MAWVDLSAAFGYGTKLTSTQMQNLRDNIAAAFAKDSGAPQLANSYVTNAMVSSGGLHPNRFLPYDAGDVVVYTYQGSLTGDGDFLSVMLPVGGELSVKYYHTLQPVMGASSAGYTSIYRNATLVNCYSITTSTVTARDVDLSGWSPGDILKIKQGAQGGFVYVTSYCLCSSGFTLPPVFCGPR